MVSTNIFGNKALRSYQSNRLMLAIILLMFLCIVTIPMNLRAQDSFNMFSFQPLYSYPEKPADADTVFQWIVSPLYFFGDKGEPKTKFKFDLASIATNIVSPRDLLLFQPNFFAKRGNLKAGVKFEFSSSQENDFKLGKAAFGMAFGNNKFKSEPNVIVSWDDGMIWGASVAFKLDFSEFSKVAPGQKSKLLKTIDHTLAFVTKSFDIDEALKIKYDLLLTYHKIANNKLSLFLQQEGLTKNLSVNWSSNASVGYRHEFRNGSALLISAGIGILGPERRKKPSLYTQFSL